MKNYLKKVVGNMNNYKIITVINAVSPTSMPLNEFLKYRKQQFKEVGSILTLTSFDFNKFDDFSDLEINSFRSNTFSFVKFLWNHSDQILHLHQPRIAFLVTIITVLLPKKFRRLVTVHNNFDKFKSITKMIIFFNVLFADKVTFVSQSSFASFPNVYKFFFKEKCITITNGVDLSRVDSFLLDKSISRIDKKQIELVYIGKLHVQKNHDKMLRILSNLPPYYKLTIVGEGNERNRLEALIKKLNLIDRVVITGIIKREEVYSILLKADIFVSTALWEGMPIGVLESMACYLPVVLSEIPPHIEIQHKSSVNLICNEESEFVNKIIEYGSLNSSDRLKLGVLNRAIVENNFELKIMHKKYDEVYKILSS